MLHDDVPADIVLYLLIVWVCVFVFDMATPQGPIMTQGHMTAKHPQCEFQVAQDTYRFAFMGNLYVTLVFFVLRCADYLP